MSKEIMDLVQVLNDQVVTTSLKIAEYFPEKRHRDIVVSIDRAVAQFERLNEGARKNPLIPPFIKSSYEYNGRSLPMYYLNRDGFSFIVMGFTGDKAAEFKWKFIEAFNAMESKLKYGTDKVPQTFLEALELAVEKEKQRLALEEAYYAEQERADNAEREAKANQDAKDLQDQATKRRIGYDLGKAAKFLNVKDLGRNRLFKFLRDNGDFFYDRNGYNTVKQSHVNQKRFFEYIDETYEYPVIYITPKGMRYVLKALINAGYKPQITAEEWERQCQLDQEEEEE